MAVPPETIDPSVYDGITHYDVGDHQVTVARRGTWWFAALDGSLLPGKFPSAAAAWTAGVRRADEAARG